jgi:hypothetical protein
MPNVKSDFLEEIKSGFNPRRVAPLKTASLGSFKRIYLIVFNPLFLKIQLIFF